MHPQTIIPPHPCLTVPDKFSILRAKHDFLRTICSPLIPKLRNLLSSAKTTFSQNDRGLFTCSFANAKFFFCLLDEYMASWGPHDRGSHFFFENLRTESLEIVFLKITSTSFAVLEIAAFEICRTELYTYCFFLSINLWKRPYRGF